MWLSVISQTQIVRFCSRWSGQYNILIQRSQVFLIACSIHNSTSTWARCWNQVVLSLLTWLRRTPLKFRLSWGRPSRQVFPNAISRMLKVMNSHYIFVSQLMRSLQRRHSGADKLLSWWLSEMDHRMTNQYSRSPCAVLQRSIPKSCGELLLNNS